MRAVRQLRKPDAALTSSRLLSCHLQDLRRGHGGIKITRPTASCCRGLMKKGSSLLNPFAQASAARHKNDKSSQGPVLSDSLRFRAVNQLG